MALNDEQIEQYIRHLSLGEIGGKGQEKLVNSSVLVIGHAGYLPHPEGKRGDRR